MRTAGSGLSSEERAMEAVDKLCEPHSPAITKTAEISSNFLPEYESGKCDFFSSCRSKLCGGSTVRSGPLSGGAGRTSGLEEARNNGVVDAILPRHKKHN